MSQNGKTYRIVVVGAAVDTLNYVHAVRHQGKFIITSTCWIGLIIHEPVNRQNYMTLLQMDLEVTYGMRCTYLMLLQMDLAITYDGLHIACVM